jgi:histidyl-tRNA synthetase
MKKKLSIESYKGVRDFYPKDMFVQNYIFMTWQSISEQYGFEKYDASIIEPTDLYRAKSGSELVEEQTYTFKDRGDRDVTLRPEMTPTLARMVAKKSRELVFPVRWYSIPNMFRYERPQKGRLREFWQLNADIFGVESLDAEVEIISMASDIMLTFGLTPENFTIRINDRSLVSETLKELNLDEETEYKLRKLIDQKSKIKDFDKKVEELIGKPFVYNPKINKDIQEVTSRLEILGIKNVEFDPYLMRGLDYYTGIVFEVFDNHKDNNRAIFGGGRYDKLLEIFDMAPIPAVGFGMGDVTMKDVLETYNKIPEYSPSSIINICLLDPKFSPETQKIAQTLRDEGLSLTIDYSGKKVGDMIKKTIKRKVPYVICVGEDEITNNKFVIKNLVEREETEVKGTEGIINFFLGTE